MKQAITFDDYETISDTLLNLGQGFTLKMCVNLGNKNKDSERQPMSAEYLYRTKKYVNKDMVVSVKRKFFPYLSIEYKDDSEMLGKGMVQITHYTILGFRNVVQIVNSKLNQAFAIKNQKLIIVSSNTFEEVSVLSNHAIKFKPIIISYQDQTSTTGVRLEINDNVFLDMTIEVWNAFLYYILTADLYGWAASIVSGYTSDSIGTGVSDMRSISKNPTLGEEIPDSTGFGKTKPLTKEEKRKSFFDDD